MHHIHSCNVQTQWLCKAYVVGYPTHTQLTRQHIRSGSVTNTHWLCNTYTAAMFILSGYVTHTQWQCSYAVAMQHIHSGNVNTQWLCNEYVVGYETHTQFDMQHIHSGSVTHTQLLYSTYAVVMQHIRSGYAAHTQWQCNTYTVTKICIPYSVRQQLAHHGTW